MSDLFCNVKLCHVIPLKLHYHGKNNAETMHESHMILTTVLTFWTPNISSELSIHVCNWWTHQIHPKIIVCFCSSGLLIWLVSGKKETAEFIQAWCPSNHHQTYCSKVLNEYNSSIIYTSYDCVESINRAAKSNKPKVSYGPVPVCEPVGPSPECPPCCPSDAQ